MRELRQTKGWTLHDLAGKVGVGFTYLSRVENERLNYGDYPSDALIHRLADALDADEEELLMALPTVLAAAAVGLLGYGVSLTCFVLALRHLGTARTGAYFSLAPFVGALLSLAIFQDGLSIRFGLAATSQVRDGVLIVRGAVLSIDGRRRITATHRGPANTPLAIGQELAAMLIDEGANEILQHGTSA